MTNHTTEDEQIARDAIREAFPLDAGLSAERTWQMHAELRPAAPQVKRARRSGFVIGISVAASLAIAAGVFAVYSVQRDSSALPPVSAVAERSDSVYPSDQPASSPQHPAAVQAMALRALNPSGKVLHFTSEAKTAFGPDAGESTEEMWIDTKTGAGRMIHTQGSGAGATKTTVISDGHTALVTRGQVGQPVVTERVQLTGRLAKSFDKLATYRKMLESGTATVTATGMVDGEKTYKLRAEVVGFGRAGVRMVMEAEIRAKDYLPISCNSSFVDPSGKALPLSERKFSKFEVLSADGLPGEWFSPKPIKTQDGRIKGVVDL